MRLFALAASAVLGLGGLATVGLVAQDDDTPVVEVYKTPT